MKKTLFAAVLLATASLASAGPVPTPALASTSALTTVEVDVLALNCALCSDAMKKKLMQVSGARDIEPRLECGKIYLDMPAGAQLNERNFTAALKENGASYDGARPSKKSLADVRKTSPESCG